METEAVVINEHLIVLIQMIVFLAPLVGVIWKISRVVGMVEKQNKDIDNLGSKIRSVEDRQEKNNAEIIEKTSGIEKALIQHKTTLDHIYIDLTEVKTDLKKMWRNDESR
jgi:methyl coenzyme M reductase subunit C